jgi:hypothetical protein
MGTFLTRTKGDIIKEVQQRTTLIGRKHVPCGPRLCSLGPDRVSSSYIIFGLFLYLLSGSAYSGQRL